MHQLLLRPASKNDDRSHERRPDKIRVAVVGCGYWGAKHVRILNTLSDVSEVFVVDPSVSVRRKIASTFRGTRTAASLSSILNEIDAVVVATPPQDHKAIALKAIRAGKHVLIEKPLATNIQDAREIRDAANHHATVLMVGHTFEFNPAVRELKARMDSGELGEICYIHSARLNLGLYRSDVNVVWDLAPHDISIMNYLLGSTPDFVGAWGSSRVSKVTDLAYFQLDYSKRGVMGYGHVSWLDPRKIRQLTVVGTKKMAVYDDLAEERLRIFDKGVNPGTTFKNEHASPVSYRYGDIISPHINLEEPLLLEDQHFIECIRKSTPPMSDGSSGLAVVSVLAAIDKAMSSGRVVPVYSEAPSIVPDFGQ